MLLFYILFPLYLSLYTPLGFYVWLCSYQAYNVIRSNSWFKGSEEQLSALRSFIQSEVTDPDQRQKCVEAIDPLGWSFKAMQNAEVPLECGMIYMWPLAINEGFLDILKGKHPVALILLAFYCTQLHLFSDYWFVGQRGQVLLSEVSLILPSQFTSWLDWPRAMISQKWGT